MSQQHLEKLSVGNLNSQQPVIINTSNIQQYPMNFTPNLPTEKMTSDLPQAIELPKEHNTSVYIMAGAAAGIMEHCVMYPVDSIKVKFSYVISICLLGILSY